MIGYLMRSAGLLVSVTLLCGCTMQEGRDTAHRAEIHEKMKRVMDFQVKAYGNNASWNWQAAPFWAGVLAAHKATGDEAFYEQAKAWGTKTGWTVSERYFHADDV